MRDFLYNPQSQNTRKMHFSNILITIILFFKLHKQPQMLKMIYLWPDTCSYWTSYRREESYRISKPKCMKGNLKRSSSSFWFKTKKIYSSDLQALRRSSTFIFMTSHPLITHCNVCCFHWSSSNHTNRNFFEWKTYCTSNQNPFILGSAPLSVKCPACHISLIQPWKWVSRMHLWNITIYMITCVYFFPKCLFVFLNLLQKNVHVPCIHHYYESTVNSRFIGPQ